VVRCTCDIQQYAVAIYSAYELTNTHRLVAGHKRYAIRCTIWCERGGMKVKRDEDDKGRFSSISIMQPVDRS
jgi:hypothetical protein